MDYSYFISPHAGRRRPAITRELTKLHYTVAPEAISLAEGMPNETTFPFEEIQIRLKNGQHLLLRDQELGAGLQYIPTQGYPPLVNTLKEFTLKIHQPPAWDRSELIITNGSQDGISKTIEMCVQECDCVLVPNPLYAGIEIILKPYRTHLIPMEQDEFGIIPHLLRRTLEEHHQKCLTNPLIKMPKLMYINPTGANPNGSTMPFDRRQEIYMIACKFNLLILEDDPYCFMHFLDQTPPSFLSLDTEGRVMRFDSFSKVLSSGLRVGWVTGPKQLITAVELHIQSASLHSSTLSQVIVNKLLNNWGMEKLLEHFEFVRHYYKARRDLTLAAMERHLTGLAEWTVPSAGMFMWIKVHGIRDVYEMLTTRGLQKQVIFAPGHAFMVDPSEPCNYIRASYSKASPKNIDIAFARLAELIREEKALLLRKLENCT